jgi:MFS family permease
VSASQNVAPPARFPVWITPTFLLSGFAALIYQTVWQRVLFAAFGITIEAVTIVVTAFLIGLGFGSLIGGELSKSARRLLIWFGVIELSVAAYGSISVPLFRAVGDLAVSWPAVLAQAASFALVLAPTLLMGATLPLLVAYAVRVSGNVGRSVGWLYFVNTAGSAIAAISTALFVLGHFGERGSVWIAALVNATVGTFVLTRHRSPGPTA